MPATRVHFLPERVTAESLAGSTCIVVDVLRATTTITAALAAGARDVLPLLTIDEARQAAGKLPAGSFVLGGERSGGKIAGFDLGNSPAEYTPATVGGKTLIITTTNGTKALLYARSAQRVFLGSFVNLSAVCRIAAAGDQVDILCAGTDGQITREDVLLAGAIVSRLAEQAAPNNDQAILARDAWRHVSATHGDDLAALRRAVQAELRNTQGGRNLIGMGLDDDLLAAGDIDRYAVVPEFNAATGRITNKTMNAE